MSDGASDQGSCLGTLLEAASWPFLKEALDLGFNFFGEANLRPAGSSAVGRALAG